MRNLLILAAIAAMAWYGYGRHQARQAYNAEEHDSVGVSAAPRMASLQTYSCDGRTYCSEMHSCEEATFFLRNCPGTKMDGDHDGIPCEQQWCK